MVAHGVGGLAARALVQREGVRSGIRSIVTLGTPHGGTLAFPWLRLGPFRVDVRPGSDALRALSGRLPARIEAIAISSPDDAMLLPPAGARWPEACNVSVEGSGHLGLLVSSRVYELISENLALDRVPAAGRRGD
jgi:triacylglycerol esterase/lipase EstA (alpha/beta hydrolase family)